jgi:hypothetical protein
MIILFGVRFVIRGGDVYLTDSAKHN